MNPSDDPITIYAAKPRGMPATILAARGACIAPLANDEGPADRYVLSDRLVVERRTATAFMAGILDRTLFTNAIYLREHYALPVLVVEGVVDYGYRGCHPQAVRGALTAMALQYGLSVLQTADLEETVDLIALMARQEQVGIPDISLTPKRRAADLPDLQRRVVEMLPGCGMVAARALLRRFGSVRAIVEATEEDLRDVAGLGARRAAHIREVLHARYEAVDTERDLEDAIEAAPELLFAGPVTLVARQLRLGSADGAPLVADMVYLDEQAHDVIVVELKRGAILPGHVAQIRRYLRLAAASPVLAPLLEKGCRLQGLLASPVAGGCVPDGPDVSVRTVDGARAARVLADRREERG